MRQGAALAAWFDDPATPSRARAASADAAREAAAVPALAAFRRAVAQAEPGNAGLPVIENAVADLLSDAGWCAELIARYCARLTADPFFAPPQRSIDNGLHAALIVHDDARLTVSLGTAGVEAIARRKTADAGRRALILSGRRAHLRFLRSGDATIAFHEVGVDGRLRPAGRRDLCDGDGFVIDGDRATWVVDHAVTDIVLVQATLKDGGGPYQREFDPATGREIARSTTDEAASRTQMLVSLLGAMGRVDAAPTIAASLGHVAPFVRWHVMRELVALDPQAGLPSLLALAASDPEPEVRGAARATLGLLRERLPCRA